MQITVLGPGAIGTLLGSLLRVGGHDVTLVGRRKTGQEDRPVRLVLPDGWLLAEGLRHEKAERGGTDAFLITLGRHHLRALRRPDFTRLVSGEGPVYMLNCDPSEAERLALTPERCRFGLTLTTAVKLQEGEVELASSRSALIVEKHAIGRQLFDCLEHHGFEVLEVDDALPFLGSFFLFQLLFLPVALCNLTLPAFLAAAEGRELARNILLEGFLTMEKSGQPLAALPMMDPQDLLTGLEKKPLSFQVDQDQPDRSYNTVLQAYLRGRQVETAHLNRRLVEIASSAGLHLVWNWRVAQKAGRVAGAGFYRDPAELLRSLQ
jgi:ketopantoate reductase